MSKIKANSLPLLYSDLMFNSEILTFKANGFYEYSNVYEHYMHSFILKMNSEALLCLGLYRAGLLRQPQLSRNTGGPTQSDN